MKRFLIWALLIIVIAMSVVLSLRIAQHSKSEPSSEVDTASVVPDTPVLPADTTLYSAEEVPPLQNTETSPLKPMDDSLLPVIDLESDEDSLSTQVPPPDVPSPPAVAETPSVVPTPEPPMENAPGLSENEGEIIDL